MVVAVLVVEVVRCHGEGETQPLAPVPRGQVAEVSGVGLELRRRRNLKLNLFKIFRGEHKLGR